MKYYRNMMKKWKPAFTRGKKDFRTLRRHWDKWIESSDGGRKVGLANGDETKTAYNVLRTRSEADACVPSDDEEDDDVDRDEEFDYESEEDEIILSNWGGRKSVNRARVNNNNYDSGEEEDESGSDDDSSDDGSDGGGGGEKHSRDDESGNDDDDGDNVGRGQKYGGDDESGDDDDEDDDGMSNEGREDEDDEGDDEVVGGGRRLNGLGRMLEEEAVAAGMRDRITNKQCNNKRKMGNGLPQSEATGERPKRNRRVPARNNE